MKKVKKEMVTEPAMRYIYISDIKENIMLPARNGYPEVNINSSRYIEVKRNEYWDNRYIRETDGRHYNENGRFIQARIDGTFEIPSYWHKNDIELYLNSMSIDELKRLDCSIYKAITVLEKIDMYVNMIISYDQGLQNHNSEYERCKKYAIEILAIYNELLNLIDEVPEKDAKMAISTLQRLFNFYWMRVLGDQLKYLDGLEQALKELYNNEGLHIKARKHYIKEKLVKCEDNQSIAHYICNID